MIQLLLKTSMGKQMKERLEKQVINKILEDSRRANDRQIEMLKDNHLKEIEDLKYLHDIEMRNKDHDNELIIERVEQRVKIKERELETERIKLIGLQDQARSVENTHAQYIFEMKQLEYELQSLFKLIQPIVQLSARFQEFFTEKGKNPKQKIVDETFARLGLEAKQNLEGQQK